MALLSAHRNEDMIEPWDQTIVISLPPTWRLVLFAAAVGLLPTLLLAHWLARHWARSYLAARLRGWWRS
jgi:hypothetical protein